MNLRNFYYSVLAFSCVLWGTVLAGAPSIGGRLLIVAIAVSLFVSILAVVLGINVVIFTRKDEKSMLLPTLLTILSLVPPLVLIYMLSIIASLS